MGRFVEEGEGFFVEEGLLGFFVELFVEVGFGVGL